MLDVRYLPVRIRRRQWRVLVPWLQDPVQEWSESGYRQALALQRWCDRHDVPVVNRVELLTNAGKTEGARLMREAGFRTPVTVPIEDPAEFRETLCGLTPPLFVREDWGHDYPMHRADTVEEVRALPIETLKRPVATEIVDVRSPDGLYRKYRYVLAGDIGVTHHVHVTDNWVTRGGERIADEQTKQEELAYLTGPDPHDDRFRTAQRLLGLDFVSFDYGYDHAGEVVVWEANPYPYIKFSTSKIVYRNFALHRTVAAMLRLYLTKAELPVPEPIEAGLEYPPYERETAA